MKSFFFSKEIDLVKPVPTITAVGVAKPNAHGQAIDKTVIE